MLAILRCSRPLSDAFREQVAQEIESLTSERDALREKVELLTYKHRYATAEIDRLQHASYQLHEEVCQTLGKALGYPWLKDDQDNFPGATEADGVCVGEHVAESLAVEAAKEIKRLRQRLEIDRAYDGEGREVEAPEGAPDGIECRDETIRLLEAEVESLQKALWPFAQFERQLSAMFNMLGGPEDSEPDDSDDSEIITAANGQGAHFTLRRHAFRRARKAMGE